MNRLDRYYIPAGVPNKPVAPPLPRKGILMMPPPPVPPMGNQRPKAGNWQYQQVPSSLQQPQSLPPQHMIAHPIVTTVPMQTQPQIFRSNEKIRPERSANRRPIPSAMVAGSRRAIMNGEYEELHIMPTQHVLKHGSGSVLDSQNLASAMSLPDASPRMALQKILMLYENSDHREAAAFMRRLSFQTFRQILPQIPADIFIESMPHSLPILEALYAKLFLAGDSKLLGNAQSLRPEAVIWQLVKFFANQDDGLAAGQMRWEFCGPFISSCKRLLQVLLSAEPRLKRLVSERKKALMKAIEGLGQHGMVGTSDEQLMNLHKALKLEFDKSQKTYSEALLKLEQLSLLQNKTGKGTISGKSAPIAQSHQRQLSLKAGEIQERLIKNKSLLNVVEPSLENTSLEVLLGILQQRIELDKECLFQYTQIKKDSMPKTLGLSLTKNTGSNNANVGKSTNTNTNADNQSVAPVLMRYQRGCQQVLELIREVVEDDLDKEGEEEGNCSDISGYHSDSESCVMTSGNSPFISKEARYNFLTRSVRLGSKHNVRASILASSLCLDSTSLAGSKMGSIKGPGSIVSEVLRSRSHPKLNTGPPSLVIHSSSGVSSGSADSSDTASNEDKSESPTPSSSSNGTVKRISGHEIKVGVHMGGRGPSGTMRPRHLKQRSVSSLSKESAGTSVSAKLSKFNDTESTLTPGEPIYQGIIEQDISIIRKEAEIASLNEEVTKLRSELNKFQKTIFAIEDNEKELKSQLAAEKQKTFTLEKMVSSTSATMSASGKGGSTYGTLDMRPSGLVKKYGELYAQMRLETLDALDKLPELVNSEELKNKLLFSVVVLGFRSVTTTIQSKREHVRRILQLPPPPPNDQSSSEAVDPAAKDLEQAISIYLRRATENFDLSKNVEEVCSQIWATLYDYPCLKTSDGIIRYVKECVRVAWGLVNQVPNYVVEYENRKFQPDLHVRFHSSKTDSDLIQTYLWPALLEGENGPCVQKGVVIT